MNWLLFLIIIGPGGAEFTNNGMAIAQTLNRDLCDVIGDNLAHSLSLEGVHNGYTFSYRCVERTGA